MSSSGVNVLRWSALGLGIFYGFYHQTKLTTQTKLNEIDREYKHKENLIQKAKAEYAKKTSPQSSQTEGDGVITDPMDSKFDLEAYLTLKMADEAK